MIPQIGYVTCFKYKTIRYGIEGEKQELYRFVNPLTNLEFSWKYPHKIKDFYAVFKNKANAIKYIKKLRIEINKEVKGDPCVIKCNCHGLVKNTNSMFTFYENIYTVEEVVELD